MLYTLFCARTLYSTTATRNTWDEANVRVLIFNLLVLQELEVIKQRMQENEEELAKLRQMQSKLDKELVSKKL